MPTMLDLYSGLGGASEAFVQAGWTVIRIENNEELQYIPHTRNLDVLKWKEWIDILPQIDLVWASPPCLEFSNAYNAPKIRALRDNVEFNPDMSHLHAAISIIRHLDPSYWVIENVAGAKTRFSPVLGKPRQVIESFVLWGNFPYLHLQDFRFKKIDKGPGNPLRANYRAMIPFEISFELLSTIRSQKTLLEWV